MSLHVSNKAIMDEVSEAPYPLVFATISGAHLYGFPSPDSDYDLRGVHVLPVQDVLGLEKPNETISLSHLREATEVDLVTHDLKKFVSLMLKSNGYVLEQLFSPLVVVTSPAHAELKLLGTRCITKHHVHHYAGFAKTQWNLFLKSQPYLVKPLLYVFRVLLTGMHLMRTGEVEPNILNLNEIYRLPYIPELVEQKINGTEHGAVQGLDLDFFQSEFDRLFSLLQQCSEESKLPEQNSATRELSELLVRTRLSPEHWANANMAKPRE